MSENHRNKGNIDNINTHKHGRSLSGLLQAGQ